jgi:hypothetical protein
MLVGPTPAFAAASYNVAMTEQVTNQVYVFNANTTNWNAAASKVWGFNPGSTTGAWANLSDVRLRSTAAHGEVALVTASGGKAAMVDVKAGKVTATSGDVLWQASPGGNPHAIERIPNNGSVVVASSGGFLTLYSPSAISQPSTLAKVQTVTFAGAHGVLWDPTYNYLWAIGSGKLVPYAVTGSGRSTRLVAGTAISLGTYTNSAGVVTPNLGHDLQPSYAAKNVLLITHTTGVFSVNTSTRALTRISSAGSVKAYVNHTSGERAWLRADGTGSRTWGSPTVQFFTSAGATSFTRTRTGAEFYKVRHWTAAFE